MLGTIVHRRRRFGTRIMSVAVCLLAFTGVSGVVHAAQEIRFKVIDGKLCAKCVLRCGTKAIPANVVIDLGVRAPLVVHERTAKLLGLTPTSTMEVRFDNDLAFTDLRARGAKLSSLEELTNAYSTELEEIPAVAIMGLPAFANFSPQLEIGQGVLRLLAPAEPRKPAATQPAPAAAKGDGAEVTSCSAPFEEKGYGSFLTGSAPDGFAVRVMFSTSGHDTVIDSNTADLAGSPGGDIDQLSISGLNIARYVAFRPQDLSSMPTPRADVILGTYLLSHFRVTIDLVNHIIEFEQTRAPQFPAEERAYFVAQTKGDAEGIESFLKTNASSRLAAEASEKLLALRMDEYPPNRDAIGRALRRVAESAARDRRAGTMAALADQLIGGKRDDKYDLAAETLKIGMEYAPVALNGRTAHDIRARMGLVALRRNDPKQARRDLLSAAFGIPRDPMVNLWLGELYEQTGQLTRAWSRYVQSALSDNAPPEATVGLDRLNRNRGFRESFTMADAEQLLEGRMVEFHPAGRFDDAASQPSSAPNGTKPTKPSSHVRLVELFTCIDHPLTQGPELAFSGLREYFGQADADPASPTTRKAATATEPNGGTGGPPAAKKSIAFIEYHIAAPETDPLVSTAGASRAAFYGVKAAPAVCFDGGNVNTDEGGEKDAEKIFSAYKTACRVPQDAASAWELDGHATATGDDMAGTIVLTGPAGTPALRLHVLLCEKIVMAPGTNKLFLHRMVARASLSPSGGFALPPAAGGRRFDIHANVAKISDALEQAISAQEKERGVKFVVRPTYVDVGACVVVAILQDEQSKQVVNAWTFDVVPAARSKP